MSLFSDRTQSALVVIDVQNGVVENAFSRDAIIGHMSDVVEKARSHDVPVIWVQHSDEELVIDSHEWQIVPELMPLMGEKIIRKLFRDSFVQTQLGDILDDLKVAHLYICGAQTNNCVRHTSHGALERGYDITLVSDAHTTSGYEWRGHVIEAEAVINEQNDNFSGFALPGRKASVVESASITF
ncbi:MAG: isochorismatase family protein [Streptomycetaceae bacterium]|nr:MAG: isochorismatase family protein [Streptomycetaceae bacterium]